MNSKGVDLVNARWAEIHQSCWTPTSPGTKKQWAASYADRLKAFTDSLKAAGLGDRIDFMLSIVAPDAESEERFAWTIAHLAQTKGVKAARDKILESYCGDSPLMRPSWWNVFNNDIPDEFIQRDVAAWRLVCPKCKGQRTIQEYRDARCCASCRTRHGKFSLVLSVLRYFDRYGEERGRNFEDLREPFVRETLAAAEKIYSREFDRRKTWRATFETTDDAVVALVQEKTGRTVQQVHDIPILDAKSIFENWDAVPRDIQQKELEIIDARVADFQSRWPKLVDPFVIAGGFSLYPRRYTGDPNVLTSEVARNHSEKGIAPHVTIANILAADPTAFVVAPISDLDELRQWLIEVRRFLYGVKERSKRRGSSSVDDRPMEYVRRCIRDGAEWLSFFGIEWDPLPEPRTESDADFQLAKLIAAISVGRTKANSSYSQSKAVEESRQKRGRTDDPTEQELEGARELYTINPTTPRKILMERLEVGSNKAQKIMDQMREEGLCTVRQRRRVKPKP